MSLDQVTEVTTQSWFNRLSQSFKGIAIGLLLFIVAFPLLFWNEGRAVDRTQALAEGTSVVISIPAEAVDPQNAGHLVHVSGMTRTEDVLTDPEFEISENAIRLQRHVEMFQWIENQKSETREKLGGGTETVTTYTYEKSWSENLQRSTAFHQPEGHVNPATMPIESSSFLARTVNLGAFHLNQGQISSISRAQPLPLASLQLPAQLYDKPVIRQGEQLFLGKEPAQPRVGDMRVSFSVTKPSEISLIAQQQGDSFTPYKTKTGEINLQEDGLVPAAAMFKAAQDQNATLSWILRAVGFFIMFLGLKLVLTPLRTLAAVVPFIADVVGMGIGLVAFLIAASLSLVSIAIAWIYARPVLGVVLLLIGLGLPLLLKFMKKPSEHAPVEASPSSTG